MDGERTQKKFPNRVAELRARQGMVLEELAERSHVDLCMLKQLEEHILPKELTVDDIYALSIALQCKAHEIFE